MKTYQIIGRTNSYIAQRDGQFNGKCEITISSGLTLSAARAELLYMFNNSYETSYPNWGVVMHSNKGNFYCRHHSDGTYGFEYDSRYFNIKEENEED